MEKKKPVVSKIQFNQAYYAALDLMPALIFIQDKKNKPIFFNQTWIKFTDKTTNQTFHDLVHPDDWHALEAAFNQTDQYASSYLEFRLKNNAAQYRWMCDHRTPLFDMDASLIGYLNDCYDIHEVKLEKDTTAYHDERDHFVVRSTGIGVWDLQLAENQLSWNDNMFQIFNVDPTTFKGTYDDFKCCVHPDDREKVAQHIKECLKTNKILKIKFRLISHPDGIRYISAQAKVSFDETGKPLRLTGINQDITASEQEKIKIKNLYQDIDNSEKKYRALFESSSDAIMLLADNKFVECNDATLLMFACPDRSHFLNAHPSDFSPLKQSNGQSSELLANEYIAKALQAGKASFSWVHQRLNGDIFPAEVLLTPVYLKNQTFIQATVRDTTKLVELQKKLTFLSMHDQLTGLYNRNALVSVFDKELARSKRHHHFFSVCMLDIDLFKQINDKYGHQAGDKVLVHLANELLSTLRVNDVAVRFGGEEILILLPETNMIEAKKLVERIRENIESAVPIAQEKKIKYTVSIGVAAYPKDGSNKQQILAAADKALYDAKALGRNQVVVS